MLPIKFDFDWPGSFREEYLTFMVIYMYIAHGWGQTTSHRCIMSNLALIGQGVLEKKIFENFDR